MNLPIPSIPRLIDGIVAEDMPIIELKEPGISHGFSRHSVWKTLAEADKLERPAWHPLKKEQTK